MGDSKIKYAFRYIDFENAKIVAPSDQVIDFNGHRFSVPDQMHRCVSLLLSSIVTDALPPKKDKYTGVELQEVINEFIDYMYPRFIFDGSDRYSVIAEIDNLTDCILDYVYEFRSMGFSIFGRTVTSPHPFISVLAIIQYDKLVAAYCENDLQKIWNLHSDISDLMGHFFTSYEIYVAKEGKSLMASRASKHRHAEHYAMKKDVLKYYQQHAGEWRSINKAAEAIAGNIVPVAVTTVRDWIRAAKKSGEV